MLFTSTLWLVFHILALVFRTVNVHTFALTVSLALAEVSFIIVSVGPDELSLAVRLAVHQLTLVF